jgi:hypothetical protein
MCDCSTPLFARSYAVIVVTLTPGATSTIVTSDVAPNLNDGAYAFPTPLTANAAAAMATTYAVISRVSGQLRLTITHANAGSTDRTFAYDIRGG